MSAVTAVVEQDGPTKAEMAAWDEDRRLRRIQQIYIEHPQAMRVRMQLDLLWNHGVRHRESATGFIVGNSRCGKSESIKRFAKSKTGLAVPKLDEGMSIMLRGPEATIVYLDTMNGATPLEASKSLLSNLFQHNVNFRENLASEKLLHFFTLAKVNMFIIDEGQKMLKGNATGFASNKFANWLLSLENAGQFSIVVAGSPELQDLIDGHPTIRDRKESAQRIGPFAYATEADKRAFGRFLSMFDSQMPFLSTPLADEGLRNAFYYVTRGRPGRLSNLLQKATQIAFYRSEGKPMATLELGHLSAAFELTFMIESQMLGINPFDHEGDLPTIPLNLEQEEGDVFEPLIEKRSRSKGSRIQKRPA